MKKYLSIFFLLAPLFVFGQTKLPLDQVNPTLRQNFKVITGGKIYGADTAYFGNVLTRPSLTGNFQFTGDSFVSGSGANPSTLRFSTQLSTLMGLTEVNGGHPGLTLAAVAAAPATYIPTKGGTDRFLLICYGQNDINAASTYTEHQFALDWNTTLNYATSHGWSANQIWLTNIGFNMASTSGSYTAPQYLARQLAFSFCVDSIATVYGCLDVKINQLMHYSGDYQMVSSDLQHPSNLGHTQIAKLAYNTYYTHLFQDGHQLEADGLAQFNQVQLPKLPSLPIGATVPSQLLGITTGDTIGRLNQLPSGIGTAKGGVFNVNGQILQQGWTTPSGVTLGTFDIGLNEVARIGAYYTPNPGLNLYNYFQPMDGSGNLNITVAGTSPPGVIQMTVNGTIAEIVGSTSIKTPVDIKFTSLNKQITYDDGSNTYHGGLIPLSGSGNTTLFNSLSIGYLQFLVSNGSNGGSLEAGRISKLGNWLIGSAPPDHGIKLDITGSTRVSSTANFGLLGVVSQTAPTGHTTGGTIPAGTTYAYIVPVDAFGNEGYQTLELSTVTTGSTSSIDYSWSALTNATKYRVYLGTSSNGENKYLETAGTSITYIGSGTTANTFVNLNKTTLGYISNLGAANFTSANISNLTASKLVFTDASKNLTSTGIGTSSQGVAGDGSLFTLYAKPHNISTPTTGGTVNLTNNQYNIINPAGTLATLTVNLPSSPSNNDCVYIKYTQAITAVTYGNGTVVDGITAPTAGGLVILTYDSGTASWY